MKCSKCGQEIIEVSRFCLYCGNPVQENRVTPEVVEDALPPAAAPSAAPTVTTAAAPVVEDLPPQDTPVHQQAVVPPPAGFVPQAFRQLNYDTPAPGSIPPVQSIQNSGNVPPLQSMQNSGNVPPIQGAQNPESVPPTQEKKKSRFGKAPAGLHVAAVFVSILLVVTTLFWNMVGVTRSTLGENNVKDTVSNLDFASVNMEPFTGEDDTVADYLFRSIYEVNDYFDYTTLFSKRDLKKTINSNQLKRMLSTLIVKYTNSILDGTLDASLTADDITDMLRRNSDFFAENFNLNLSEGLLKYTNALLSAKADSEIVIIAGLPELFDEYIRYSVSNPKGLSMSDVKAILEIMEEQAAAKGQTYIEKKAVGKAVIQAVAEYTGYSQEAADVYFSDFCSAMTVMLKETTMYGIGIEELTSLSKVTEEVPVLDTLATIISSTLMLVAIILSVLLAGAIAGIFRRPAQIMRYLGMDSLIVGAILLTGGLLKALTIDQINSAVNLGSEALSTIVSPAFNSLLIRGAIFGGAGLLVFAGGIVLGIVFGKKNAKTA